MAKAQDMSYNEGTTSKGEDGNVSSEHTQPASTYYWRTVPERMLVRSEGKYGERPEAWMDEHGWFAWPYFDAMHEGVPLNAEQAQKLEPKADLNAEWGPEFQGVPYTEIHD